MSGAVQSAANRGPLLVLDDLSFSYRAPEAALDAVSLSVDRGERVAILGASGGGKSTLLKCVQLLLSPTRGRLIYDGTVVAAPDQEPLKGRALRRYRQNMAFLFQDYNVVDHLTLVENVMMGRLFSFPAWRVWSGCYPKSAYAEAEDLLARVKLQDRAYQPAGELSGGQKQRVALARALFQRAQLLLADEPVSSLDPATGAHVLTTLCELQTRHPDMTVIFNMHDVGLAKRFATRVIGLREGRLFFDLKPEAVTDEWVQTLYD